MLVPIVLVVGTKDCLQTNYGNVIKFIAVPSLMCVENINIALAPNMPLPFFFDVVCTQVHCLPINYALTICQNIAVIVFNFYIPLYQVW